MPQPVIWLFYLVQAGRLKKGEISISARQFDFALAIGGAAGQGIATPGDILARIFVRRGLHLNTYNAYQSIVRGGHIFLTVRIGDQPVLNHDNDYAFFRPRVTQLEDEGHDTGDWKAACEKAMLWGDMIYIGLFLQAPRPTLEEHEPVLSQDAPLAHRPLG